MTRRLRRSKKSVKVGVNNLECQPHFKGECIAAMN